MSDPTPAFPVIYPLDQRVHGTLGLTKLEYIATQLMAANMIQDRIAWTEDHECFGMNDEDLAYESVRGALLLLKELEKVQKVREETETE